LRRDLVERRAELVEIATLVELAAAIVRRALQALEELRVDRRRAELLHRLRQALAHALVGQRLGAERDDGGMLVEGSVPREVVERREQLALREIAAAAEDHQLAGWGGNGGLVDAALGAHEASRAS